MLQKTPTEKQQDHCEKKGGTELVDLSLEHERFPLN